MAKLMKKENPNYKCSNCQIYLVKNKKRNKCSICDIEKIRSKRKIINKFLKKEISIFKIPKLYPFIVENNFQKNDDEIKCFHCAKKIGIFAYNCKCKNYFCKKHKFSEEHNCLFDYKKFEKNIIRRKHFVMKKSKIIYF